MKLGDNITTEAYSTWGDTPPRKCRPPKIGDIPKHSAIDEESPSSISNSFTVATSNPEESSVDFSKNIIFPLPLNDSTDQFSSTSKIKAESCRTSPKESVRFQCPSTLENEGLPLHSLNKFCHPLKEVKPATKDTRLQQLTYQSTEKYIDSEGTVSIKLPFEESISSEINIREDSFRIPSSPEDISDQEVVEVRKDSALFLEEAEGVPTLREILRTRAPKIIRPRRESSGYASNLGTFDEDRRSSSTADSLQALSSFLKERRSSSTGPKRLNTRVTLGRTGESLTEDVEIERMPTTKIHRKESGSELEMPNIEEVKEVFRDEVTSREKDLDNLCNLIKNTSFEDISTTCSYLGDSTICNTFSGCSPEKLTFSLHQHSSPVLNISSLTDSTNYPLMHPYSRNLNQGTSHTTTSSLTSSCSLQNITRSTFKSQEPALLKDAIKTIEEPQNGSISSWKDQEEKQSIDKDNLRMNVLPRSIKMYQLLSTKSEDTADSEIHLNRRIGFQISKYRETDDPLMSAESRTAPLNKSSSALTLKNSTSGDISALTSADDSSIRKVISSGEVTPTQKFLGDTSNVTVRPIYPYCPYSPYGSPQGSPRNKRRPLRESRRVSIDNRQGALQLNQYKLLDNIGQGSYGIVKLVYNEEDGIHYAMKILSKKKLMKKAGIFGRMAPRRKGTANPLAKVYREIALLKKLDHPNVVKLVEVLDDPDEDNLYLVFELVEKGEIIQVPTDKPLDEETARKNFRDVVSGVEYLHYQKIIHRDIKPSNLLVDSDGRIKVADLGVSAELGVRGELLSGPAGTPAFAAPETNTPGARYSGTLCDVWSMGVTLYCLVTGKIPWDGAGSIIGVQAAVRTEPLKFPEKPSLSENLSDLISKMLAKNPTERITLSEIKKHSWLTNNGVEPLPSEADNCRLPVTVTDEEVERVVTRIPKLDTLILIKTMLKQHSFQNPFLPKKSTKVTCNDAETDSLVLSLSERVDETLSGRDNMRNTKTERFHRTGRSNSAPDSYDWQANSRQISMDVALPPVTEASSQEVETEKR